MSSKSTKAEVNYPVVMGEEICRKGNRASVKLVYADQSLALSSELKKLDTPELASAERSVSKKGGIFLYSYIAPARYGARLLYANTIILVNILLFPLLWPISLFNLFRKWGAALIFDFFDAVLFAFGLLGTLMQWVLSAVMFLLLIGFMAFFGADVYQTFR